MPVARRLLRNGPAASRRPGIEQRGMMYDSYQAMADVSDAVRLLAFNAERILNVWASGPFASPFQRMAAYYEVVALAGFTHERPPFDIPSIEVRGETIPVEEEVVLSTDFCDQQHFGLVHADVGPFRYLAARHVEDDAPGPRGL